ncbi:MAG: helix-turn-helix domain-containing protein [Clostridiaceae bacterium]
MGKKALLREASEITGMSKWFLRQGARNGTIPCIKSGNRYVFDLELLDEYLKNMAIENTKPKEENVKKYGSLRKVGDH